MNATTLTLFADADPEIGWPSAIVALALVGLVGAIMLVAIKKYEADSVLKIWAALGALVGIMTGSFGTYFFTRGAAREKIAAAESKAEYAQKQADKLELQVVALNNQIRDSNGGLYISNENPDFFKAWNNNKNVRAYGGGNWTNDLKY